MSIQVVLTLLVVGIALAAVGAWWAVRTLGARRSVPQDPAAFLANPRIALIGLSTREGEFSQTVAGEMRQRGYEVVGVNPHAAAQGVPGFVGSVTELPDPPPAALLMVPPDQVLPVVEDCITAGVGAVWFHRGAGPGSATPEAVSRAREAGMLVIAGACPMMYLEPVAWFHRAHRNLAGAA